MKFVGKVRSESWLATARFGKFASWALVEHRLARFTLQFGGCAKQKYKQRVTFLHLFIQLANTLSVHDVMASL